MMGIFHLSRRPLNACAASMRASILSVLLMLGIVSVIPVDLAVAANRASITAAVASGKPLSKIIKNSLSDGMKMKDSFAALTAAKVPADAIVYTSITEGLPASDVITAAMHSQGNVTKVVSAAKSAGTSDLIIAKAATSGGVKPAAISTALASARSWGGGNNGHYDNHCQLDQYLKHLLHSIFSQLFSHHHHHSPSSPCQLASYR